jgi:hypothetical protein
MSTFDIYPLEPLTLLPTVWLPIMGAYHRILFPNPSWSHALLCQECVVLGGQSRLSAHTLVATLDARGREALRCA